MTTPSPTTDKSTWAIGGGILIGIGAGFFFLSRSGGMAFAACVIIGLGLGLMVTAFLGRSRH